MLAQSCQAVGGGDPSDGHLGDGNFRGTGKNFARSRVLVVDDEALIRWSVAETLGSQNYEIKEAGDGAAAIRAVTPDGSRIDLVLLDLRLPDCDGLHVLTAIRRISPDTLVILMTAFGSPEILHEARRLGAFAIMDKPFEMEALPPLVARALAARPH
ncbi:MAG TPA: response regulator [Vicinamibacterales bacterium]|jgi:DNA-binding NtrC family response regulator|nr:response regulator [Vicinamibacterales bacterium]